MALSQRDKRALILGVVALSAMLIYFGGVEPAWRWYEDQMAGHERRALSIARIRADERKAEFYAQQIAAMEQRAGLLAAPKPYDEQITEVSVKVVTAAQQSEVELKGASPGTAAVWADDPQYQQASILIDAEAEWEKLFRFVAALNRIEGVLGIEHLELSAKGDKLAVRITASVLVQAPQGSPQRWAGRS